MESINVIGNTLQLLQILVILAGGLFFLYQIKAQLILMSAAQANFANRLASIEDEIKQLAAVTIDLAKQGERMTALDLRMTALSTRLDDFVRLTSIIDRDGKPGRFATRGSKD